MLVICNFSSNSFKIPGVLPSRYYLKGIIVIPGIICSGEFANALHFLTRDHSRTQSEIKLRWDLS